MTQVNSTPGHYDARFFLRAHYQLAGLTTVLRIVSLVAMTAGCFATPNSRRQSKGNSSRQGLQRAPPDARLRPGDRQMFVRHEGARIFARRVL